MAAQRYYTITSGCWIQTLNTCFINILITTNESRHLSCCVASLNTELTWQPDEFLTLHENWDSPSKEPIQRATGLCIYWLYLSIILSHFHGKHAVSVLKSHYQCSTVGSLNISLPSSLSKLLLALLSHTLLALSWCRVRLSRDSTWGDLLYRLPKAAA